MMRRTGAASPSALQHCLGDMASLSALPAQWADKDRSEVAENLADILFRKVPAAFVFVGLEKREEQGFAYPAARVAGADPSPELSRELDALLGPILDRNVGAGAVVIPNPLGAGTVRLLALPIGAEGRFGTLASASAVESFPGEHERLLLGMGATQGAIALEHLSLAAALREKEEALRKTEARYRSLVVATASVVWTMDPAGDFSTDQPSWEAYTGQTPEAYRGQGWKSAFSPDDGGFAAAWAHAVAESLPCEAESRVRHGPSGRFRQCVVRAAPIFNAEGKVREWTGTLTDVEDRTHAEASLQRIEEQLRKSQKMESIGNLAGGIAHDFNNLLTAINGYSALSLGQLEEKHPARAHIAEIQNAGERAADLTRQLLAYSRKQVLTAKVIDLNALVLEMEKMLRRIIGEHITLATVLDPCLRPVKADPAQIEQVLMNLAINAREAVSRSGLITIETRNLAVDDGFASAHPAVLPGEYAMLAVSDNGRGMDESVRSRIFEPFFTTKEFGRSSGLGLSTAYGIVAQSGGHIFAYSEPGVGSTFKVYLPQAEGDRGQAAAGQAAPAANGDETVLLVEDEPAVRRFSRLALERFGYRVLEACDGKEGLEVSGAYVGPIHLVLSDVVMPRLDGPHMVRSLMATRPGLRVLFMSGYTDDAIVRHGFLEANTSFIQKPFMPGKLAKAIREVLNAAPLRPA
ncbi:MAG TPA: response regulator [Fibrobacteria bacterium]|nr:response regulator [Fibrobacteria bacterium]